MLVLGYGLLCLVTGILIASGGMSRKVPWTRPPSRFQVPFSLLVCGSALLAVSTIWIASDFRSTSPSAPLDVSRLLAVLEERLPSDELSERRHRELVDAIRASQTSGVPLTDRTPRGDWSVRAGYAMLGVGLFGVLIACVLAWWPSDSGGTPADYRMVLQVGTLLGVGTLFSLGGVTLLKDLNFQVVLQRGAERGTSSSRSVMALQHGLIGPFVTGEHSILESPTQNSVSLVVRSLTDSSVRRDLLLLFVVGSADKRPLTGRLAKDYESNVGLAQARANWVREQILSSNAVSFPPNQIVTTVRGPSMTGAEVPFPRLSDDRLVLVYGLWAESADAPAANRR